MDERAAILKKLVVGGHINVAERRILEPVSRMEVKQLLKSLLSADGSFPIQKQSRAIYEGARITLISSGAEITWTRPYAWDPIALAEKATRTYSEIDTALDSFIESEWSKGIDGVNLTS